MRVQRTNQDHWEVFSTKRTPKSQPRIRLSKNGTITFTKAAVEQYHLPPMVTILTDPNKPRTIALDISGQQGENTRSVTHIADSGAATLNVERLVREKLSNLADQLPLPANVQEHEGKLVLSF